MYGVISDFILGNRYYIGIYMSDSTEWQVLAIDGGGTRSRFALATDVKRHVIEAGPANAFTDFEASVRCVRDGIAALSAAAGMPKQSVNHVPAFVGLAGVTSAEIAARLAAALPLTHAQYADDRLAALRGAIGSRDGIVAHCGTGSFFAAKLNGRTRLAGGWGSILGDEASAQWVGRSALSLALRQADGFLQTSGLLTEMLQRFDGPDGILSYAAGAGPDGFGILAPSVTDHASRGDPIAEQILRSGAEHIADALTRMGWMPGVPICLTGGIGPVYATLLPTDQRAALIEPIGTPLDGAIEMAMARRRESLVGHR